MSHWTDAKLRQLITLYSQFNNLWDKSHPCYHHLHCRHESYDKIRKSLSTPGVTVIHVLSKLWDLRGDYVAELRKIQISKKRNLSYRPRKKWFYTMHEFFYDFLDSDEKPSEDSRTSIDSSSLPTSFTNDHKYSKNQTLPANHKFCAPLTGSQKTEKINTPFIERKIKRRAKPSIFDKSGIELKNHFSWQGDEANLLKRCEDKVKSPDLEKGHFSKSRRRPFQDSSFDQVQRNTDKFSDKRSKRVQRTSSSYFRHKDQNQEHCFSNLGMSMPTSIELRRSTSNLTSSEKDCTCCFNCSNFNEVNKHTSLENSQFNLQNSENIADLKSVRDNPNTRKKESTCCLQKDDAFSDSGIKDSCDNEKVNNKMGNVRRVLCLDELSQHVTKALNDMFMELCPIDIAFNSSCTNETCTSKKEENNSNDLNNDADFEVTNEKENRQIQDPCEDKTNSVEDANFIQFGTEVARILKQTNREKALRLKAAIKQTLESAKEEG